MGGGPCGGSVLTYWVDDEVELIMAVGVVGVVGVYENQSRLQSWLFCSIRDGEGAR